MRQTLKTAILATLVVSVSGALMLGCDFTEGHDVDPNVPTEADPSLILPAGQIGAIQVVQGDLARTSSMWAGHLVGTDRQFLAQQSGDATAEDWNNAWMFAYATTLGPLHMAIDIYDERGNRVAAGIARATAAMVWGQLAALWGDIPFSEALDLEQFPTPAFDPQASVYAGAQAMLTEAIAGLRSGLGFIPVRPNGLGSDIFGRTVPMWERIANTLSARFYLHVGDYARAVARAEAGILPGGDLMAPHSTTFGAWNGWFAFTQWFRAGMLVPASPDGPSYTVRLLFPESPIYRGNAKTVEAARRGFYFTGTTIAGSGLNAGAGNFFAVATSFPMVTHLENQLILAEARLFAGNFSPAAQAAALEALNSARAWLRGRFPAGLYDDYTLADFLPGGIANPQGESPGRALLREILEERHVSLFGTVEAFNDIRRTENFLGVTLPILESRIPQRLIYPDNEQHANPNTPSPVPGIMTVTPVNAALDYRAPIPPN